MAEGEAGATLSAAVGETLSVGGRGVVEVAETDEYSRVRNREGERYTAAGEGSAERGADTRAIREIGEASEEAEERTLARVPSPSPRWRAHPRENP